MINELKKVSRHSKLDSFEFLISRKELVCLLLIAEIFCLQSTNTRLMFLFQKRNMRRKFCLEVGIEAVAIRIISLKRPCGLLV